MKNKLLYLACLLIFVVSASAQTKSFILFKQVRYNKTPTSLLPFLQPFALANENNLLEADRQTIRKSGIDSFANACLGTNPVNMDLETWAYYPTATLNKTIDSFNKVINYFKAVNNHTPIGFYAVPPKQAYQWSSIDPVNNPTGYAGWKGISDNMARLAANVDLFQPSFYTYDVDTTLGWRKMVDTTVAAIKRYSTTKKIYAFINPQYHGTGTFPAPYPEYQFIDSASWRYQLDVLYDRTDGVIIWTSNKAANGSIISWDVNFPWWRATKAFMVDKKLSPPFVLDSFNVSSVGNNANITWSTAVDTTTYRFIVQRSTDGGYNYLSVSDSIVPVSTQYTENNYQYVDNRSGVSGDLHYRLKMVNKDGSITYSDTSVAAFTSGSLAVLRIGGVNGTNGTTGNSTPGTAGTPMHVDKYSVSAGVFTYVSSIDLPVASANNIFASSSTNEGYISQSGNKQWLSVMGYAAKSVTGTIYSSTGNPNLARTMGLIKFDGSVDLSTALSNYPYSGTAATAQSSITDNGTGLWSVTNQGVSPMGVLYPTAGSKDASSGNSKVVTSSTSVITSSRSLSIFGGDLYYASGGGSNRIGTVSASGGLPTTTGTSVMTGLSVASGSTAFTTFTPSQILMFDLDPSILGYDVMYVTNTTTSAGLAGIYKYCKDATGQWVSYGTFGTTASDGSYFGITGEVINGLPVLYITRGVSASQNLATNQLIQLTETAGYYVNMSATVTASTDATISGMSGTLRGVAFFPTASYYYKGTGNLNDVSSWGTNNNGSGNSPENFTDNEQTFYINNGVTATLSANLDVRGINSKIILGDGTNATSLTIPSNFSINSEMDIYNNGVLNIQNVQSPFLHFVAKNSSVNFAASSSQTINPIAYGNFSNNNNSSAILNGTITVAGNMVQNGLLKGNGTIIVPNGFTNNGILMPGLGAGILNITGNFSNVATGTLAIELANAGVAGTDYDQLAIGGTANLAGTLNISLINGFTAVAGQTFTILTANVVAGTFTNVVWPSGIAGKVTYNTNSVVITIETGGVLPVRLISFSGSIGSNNEALLQWQTANEDNLDHFDIEYSEKGVEFEKKMTKKAIGIGNNDYHATDPNPGNPINYYRLKMVDKDGAFTYSNVIALKVDLTQKEGISIFPNPVSNTFTVSHEKAGAHTVIEIVTLAGKGLTKINVMKGAVQTVVNVLGIPAGTYILRFIDNDKVFSRKFLKLN